MKILRLLLLLPIQCLVADETPVMFLLKRDWEIGMEHRVLCESWMRGKSQSREAKNIGATTCQMLNEYHFTVWPNPAGGRLYGMQYLVNCVETRGPGLAMSFDSRKLAQGIKQDPASTGTWETIGNSWIYFDEQGETAGKTGVGWGNHAITLLGNPTPYGTISKDAKMPVIQQFTAPSNLPKEPVPVGHRWKADLSGYLRDVGMVTAKAECEFLRVEKVKNRECAVIGFRADFVALPKDEKTAGLMIENPVIEGEAWLELSTGTPVLEKSSTSCIRISENGRLRFAIDNSDRMELMTKTAIDPAAPLPLPLRSEEAENAPLLPDIIPGHNAAPREGAVLLKHVWKTGTRYVWSTRTVLEHKMDMGKGMNLPAMKGDVENEDEELVFPGEEAGSTRSEVKNLAMLVRKPELGGKVVFDTRNLLEKGDVDYEAWRMTWKQQTDSTQFMLRDAAGKNIKSWVERTSNGQAPVKDESTSWQMKTMDTDWFGNGFLPASPALVGESWPVEFRPKAIVMADDVVMKGRCRFVSLGATDGKQIATIEADGTFGNGGPEAARKPGGGTIERGTFNMKIVIDVVSSTLIESRLDTDITSRIIAPGGPGKIRNVMKQSVHRRLLSIDLQIDPP